MLILDARLQVIVPRLHYSTSFYSLLKITRDTIRLDTSASLVNTRDSPCEGSVHTMFDVAGFHATANRSNSLPLPTRSDDKGADLGKNWKERVRIVTGTTSHSSHCQRSIAADFAYI